MNDQEREAAQRLLDFLDNATFPREDLDLDLVHTVARAALASRQEVPHYDDAYVDRFAAAMKSKLAQAREKGREGWQECSQTELSRMLREHVEKGDPRDVANFCMFLWSLDYGIAASPQPAPAAREPLTERVSDLESALEALVNRCNNDAGLTNDDAVIAAEATLERLYKHRAHGNKGENK